MNRATAITVLLALAVAVVWLTGERNERSVSTISGPIMGTTFSIKVVSEQELGGEAVEEIRRLATHAMAEVNQKMSTYLASSEVSRFSAASSLEPFPISRETLEVLETASRIGKASGGALDPTVGPLVDLWGFGAGSRADLALPNEDEISSLLDNIGWDKLDLDPSASTVQKTTAELGIDLSSVAKGYAVDRVVRVLREAGYSNLLVEIGGELACSGDGPEGHGWRLGLERPAKSDHQVALNGQEIHRVLTTSQPMALATSGEYRNFYEVDGKRYSHTVDPRTGRPVQHRLGSVSVIADSCLEADGWATALNVLGPEEGFEVARDHGVAALFLIYNRDERTGSDSAELTERATPAFEPFLEMTENP